MSQMVEQIVAAASKLPPFPKVAQKILELLQDPDVSVRDQVAVVELDPNLTANVLKAVNSAYYGLPRRVDNLKEALSYLGNSKFKELVLASASVRFLSAEQGGYELNGGDLWRHSLATALMTEVLAERVKHKPGPALYTAALLHDIGKVVLSAFVKEQTRQIVAEVGIGKTFLEAEHAVLGMDHAELGGRIAAAWRFSPEMVELIASHHAPERAPTNKDLAILYLANVLTQMYGVGGGIDGMAQRAHEEVLTFLGLKKKDLELALVGLDTKLQKAQSMLAMR